MENLRRAQNFYSDEWNAAQQRRSASDSDLAAQAQARRYGAYAVAVAFGGTLLGAVLGFAAGYAGGSAFGWLLDLLA